MHLTKYEQETILLTNEEDDTWDIYTFNKALKKKLKDFAKRYPEECRLKTSTKEGSMTFEISKSRLALRLTAPYSEERRKASSERAKYQGLHDLGKEVNTDGSES